MGLRDMCKNPEVEEIGGHLYSKGEEYSELYKVLDKTGNFDVDYADHLDGKDVYALASRPDKLSFQECCTVLTFILRSEHWSEGSFAEALKDGTVYKLLSRAVEAM